MEVDLKLAYARVRDELLDYPKTGRALVANPYELELIEQDLDGWIAELEDRLKEDRFVPGPLQTCDVPKPGGLVRPGVRLSVADRVVYTAAVGACLPQLDAATRWSQGGCDIANRLDPAKLDQRRWLRNPFKGWKEWHDRSLQRLDRSAVKFVVTADIAGYFENISIGRLRSDLARIECAPEAVELIVLCLNQWARCPDRGLPQGVMASDLLAKLYLEPFDRRLDSAGYLHMRYADDVRLFAATEEEAQRGLVEITHILRERGLTLQSSKTQIREAAAARGEIDGVMPAIEQVAQGYIDEAKAAGLMAGDVSLPMVAVDDLVGGEIEPEVVRRAFETYVVERGNPNKTMLNFLLGRLRGQRDPYGVEECARLLDTHPEHTPAILRYYESLRAPGDLEATVTEALRSKTSAVYPYQRYLLLRWLDRNAEKLSESMLAVVRALAFEAGSIDYVRMPAARLLGRFGSHGDLEAIEALHRDASEPLMRAQLLCCLRTLEKGRRNGLAARVGKDEGWLGRAAALVRS